MNNEFECRYLFEPVKTENKVECIDPKPDPRPLEEPGLTRN